MKMNKSNSGTSLVELMVYMVLGILVTGYALQAISHIAKNYVHGREVTKMQSTGRDAINVIARDLANTGFKYYLLKRRVTTAGKDTVFYDFRPTSSSSDSLFLLASRTGRRVETGALTADTLASFYHGNGTPNDTIQVYRGNLQNRTDTIVSVERVTYRVVNETLYRCSQTCRNTTLNNGNIDWLSRDSMAILANVKGLQFQFSKDGTVWTDDPAGERRLMKYIRVDLLAASDRESELGAKGQADSLGSGTVARNDDRIYRSYEAVVPIPNNGTVAQ